MPGRFFGAIRLCTKKRQLGGTEGHLRKLSTSFIYVIYQALNVIYFFGETKNASPGHLDPPNSMNFSKPAKHKESFPLFETCFDFLKHFFAHIEKLGF